jgi:hypothetical protein
MAGHFETLAGVSDVRSVDPQNREVLIEIVADQNVATVRSEDSRLGQPADLDFLDFRHLLAVDAEHSDAAVTVVIIGVLGVGTTVISSDCNIALRRDGNPFRRVTNHYPVNDAWRLRFKIDDVDRVDTAI